jgi:tetratricopeptide (TPR) repeat protein
MDAIQSFTNEILLQPYYLSSYSEKANCEFSLDQFTEAYATFRSIILLDNKFINKNEELCKKYAYCSLFENRNMKDAEEYISYGIKMYPADKYFIFLKAEYAYINQQIESSKIYFKEAFEAKVLTLDQLKKDAIFMKIKNEDSGIDSLTKTYYNF